MNLIQGDCLDELKKLDAHSVDLVMCDLPYGITALEWDTKIDIDKLWKELLRVGKPNTPYFFFCTLKFGVEIINANPKMFKTDFVWNKMRLTNPMIARTGFNRSHETILVFYDKSPPYYHMKYHTKENALRKGMSKVPICGKQVDTQFASKYTPPLPLSIMDSNPVKVNQLHRTQKPLEILEKIIKYYTDDGAVVLDPTMGSGSTGEACRNLGRRFIGIEKDPEIYEGTKKRLDPDSIST